MTSLAEDFCANVSASAFVSRALNLSSIVGWPMLLAHSCLVSVRSCVVCNIAAYNPRKHMQHLEMEGQAAAEEVRESLTSAGDEYQGWAAALVALLVCKCLQIQQLARWCSHLQRRHTLRDCFAADCT